MKAFLLESGKVFVGHRVRHNCHIIPFSLDILLLRRGNHLINTFPVLRIGAVIHHAARNIQRKSAALRLFRTVGPVSRRFAAVIRIYPGSLYFHALKRNIHSA